MSLEEIMHKPTFVDKDATVKEVAKVMAEKSIGSVLVGSAERVLGIFSERDLLVKVAANDVDCNSAKVKDYMTAPVKAIDVNLSIFDVQSIMIENHIRRLPVTQGGRIVGMVSARNVMENMKYEHLKKSYAHSAQEMYARYW
ncbi:Inosine-5'-monophosphate dehydrogenase [uncultured archaeon]|nr:Inosine-5'-monophosphate dehydrogenase [uncultured archaeon]